MENEVVAVLRLREEQAMLDAGLLPFPRGEEGSETRQPFLRTGDDILGSEGIGQFLQRLRIAAVQEGVGALLKPNATLTHSVGQPVVLVEADSCREGEIGTDA